MKKFIFLRKKEWFCFIKGKKSKFKLFCLQRAEVYNRNFEKKLANPPPPSSTVFFFCVHFECTLFIGSGLPHSMHIVCVCGGRFSAKYFILERNFVTVFPGLHLWIYISKYYNFFSIIVVKFILKCNICDEMLKTVKYLQTSHLLFCGKPNFFFFINIK